MIQYTETVTVIFSKCYNFSILIKSSLSFATHLLFDEFANIPEDNKII